MFYNGRVVGNADLVTYKVPTMVASTLHAVAILLKLGKPWDWFINLCSSDYPLMPQRRYLSFIEHTSKMPWKLTHRARSTIVDPGHMVPINPLYLEKRKVCASIFQDFHWICLGGFKLEIPGILHYDSLPRTLLMYYSNHLSSDCHLHSVICNSKDFQNSTINHDLHYVLWHNPPRQHPMNLNTSHFDGMLGRVVPFARKFTRNTPVLDRIDRELLGNAGSKFTPGGWCTGSSRLGRHPCNSFGSPEVIKPTTNSKRLERLLLELLDPEVQSRAVLLVEGEVFQVCTCLVTLNCSFPFQLRL